jgi:phosphoglycolate phosphatase
MSTLLKLILFDFDGVLGDSLLKHIRFCLMVNKIYGAMPWVGERILPDENDIVAWKKLVGFPMVEFLRNIGFADLTANIIHDNDYLREFGSPKNPAPLYPYIPIMLSRLQAKGYMLGIVSMNTRLNILASLGHSADVFLEILAYDDYPDKVTALRFASSYFNCRPEEVVYVGDAIKDYNAAREAGIPFIGTTYGWEIDGSESMFRSASSPEELERMLLALD